MSAPRRFDHDEARRLRAEGVRVVEIAGRFGVSKNAIHLVVNDDYRARQRAYHAAWQKSGVCADCGGPCIREAHPSQGAHGVPLCIVCAGRRNRTRFRYDAEGAVTEIRCSTCKQWKAASSYQGHHGRAEGKHQQCRACGTRARRDYRERHKVPCERCGAPCLPPSEKGRNGAAFARCRECFYADQRKPEPGRSEAMSATREG